MFRSRLYPFFLIITFLSVLNFEGFTKEAQGASRRIIYDPRITLTTVDYHTKAPRSTFCIGRNQIDIRLTNYGDYSRHVNLINRDTRGITRTLYNGRLGPGTHYLSDLLDATFDVQGPAGTEYVWIDTDGDYDPDYDSRARFRVIYCEDPEDPRDFWITASVNPRSIPQGGRGIITVKTNASSQYSRRYYFEIYNSWGHRIHKVDAWKRSPGTYDLDLFVDHDTAPGILTYTAKLWSKDRYGRQRLVASRRFTFRVVSDYYLSERP
jgi:hypothetical protein